MPTRESFVQFFGKEEAQRIECAAIEHANPVNSKNKGSDTFRWAICICLGYECMSNDTYRECHGIVTPWEHLETWIADHGDLVKHDGDVDYVGLFAGVYEPFMDRNSDESVA